MKYMLLIFGDPAVYAATPPDRIEANMQAWFAFDERTRAAGVKLAGEALQPPETATTVQVRDGEVATTDGPFVETKEVLGGFYLLECPDLDAALEWARQIPSGMLETVEVRPVVEFA